MIPAYVDNAEEVARPKRWDSEFHQYISDITESSLFNAIILFTIFLNAVFMALETERDYKEKWLDAFSVTDEIFIGIYTVEFLMKVYAEPKNYWKSSYNIFDFGVLAISYTQAFLTTLDAGESGLQALRVLRALRTLRTLRTVSFIRGLQVLVTALLDTIRKWVINIILLLLLLMFLFAIMGYYFFGYRHDSDKQNWGNIFSSMLTLFSYVTVDGWTDLQGTLDALGMHGSRIYTIIFIFLGHFIFSNVFIGVIIMNISEATEKYKAEQQREKNTILKAKKEQMMQRQKSDVAKMTERQKRGHFSNFQEMAEGFQKTLSHTDYVMMTDLCNNLIWMETLIYSLEHTEDTLFRIQQLHFEMANELACALEKRMRDKFVGK